MTSCMEPNDDDLMLEMDDEEVARVRLLRVPEIDDIDSEGEAEFLCTECLGVLGRTCSCPEATP